MTDKVDLGDQRVSGVVAIGFFSDAMLITELRRRGFELAGPVTDQLRQSQATVSQLYAKVADANVRADAADRTAAQATKDAERAEARVAAVEAYRDTLIQRIADGQRRAKRLAKLLSAT